MTAIISILIIITAAISAYCWLKATRTDVPAPEETHGVGAMPGGYLISRNQKGERIDLHDTLNLQSKWNRLGATWACAAAGLTVLKEVWPFVLMAWAKIL